MRRQSAAIVLVLTACAAAVPAHASLFSGDTLDAVANVLSWIVLLIAPVIAITVFWLVHILPEKIAEKRHHPQAAAIKTLCLLSLVFGGLLWPLAWLWAYSRPVLYKMAYGVDKVDPHAGVGDAAHSSEPVIESAAVQEAPVVVTEAPVVVPEEAEPVVTPARATRASVRERRPWET